MDNGSSPKLVLVVDDEALMRKLIGAQIKRAGYQVEEAANGREALAKIRTLRPDLVTLDVMMPGFSGVDVLKVMVNDPASATIPVVLVTALERQMIARMEIPETMQVSLLEKPCGYDQLVAQIEQSLQRAAVQAPAFFVA